MKHLPLVLACCLALTAQQSNKKKGHDIIEWCGTASSHECHCIRHTHAVQEAYLQSCRLNSKSEKELSDCQRSVPGHCQIVDEPLPADEDEGEGDVDSSAMSDRCTMMCKKHDCRCDDGPLCHVGHSASDHEATKQ
jgi:hypothetical protein